MTSIDMTSTAWTNPRTGFLAKATRRDRRLAKAARLHSIPSDQRRKNPTCDYGYTRQNITIPYRKTHHFDNHWAHPMTHHNVARADIIRKSVGKNSTIPSGEESNGDEVSDSPFHYTYEALVSTATPADLPLPTAWKEWVAAHPNSNTAPDK